MMASAGEYILQNSPAIVVVETAATPAHGTAPGNTVSCQDVPLVPGASGFFLRMFCQIASAIQEQVGQHCADIPPEALAAHGFSPCVLDGSVLKSCHTK
jgi:hypothetical protein